MATRQNPAATRAGCTRRRQTCSAKARWPEESLPPVRLPNGPRSAVVCSDAAILAYAASRLGVTNAPILAQWIGTGIREYDALIMDTQGSELLVLQGAIPILHNFTYIKTEVSDFESYTGCCQVANIAPFMSRFGYREVSRHKFAQRPEGGSYYDIVYKSRA